MLTKKKLGKNVFITGGNGFIGSAICKELISNNYNVFKYDRSVYGPLETNQSLLSYFNTNNINIVLHYAADPLVRNSDRFTLDRNIDMSRNVIDAAITSSSVETIGFGSSILTVKNYDMPSPYATYKKFIENYLKFYGRSKKVFIARHCANVGMSATHGVVKDIIKKLITIIKGDDKTSKSTHPGPQLDLLSNSYKPYMHVDYTAKILVNKLSLKRYSHGYNITPSKSIRVDKIVEIICQELDYDFYGLKLVFNPSWDGDNNIMYMSRISGISSLNTCDSFSSIKKIAGELKLDLQSQGII